MLILKFGGTSVGTPDRIKAITKISGDIARKHKGLGIVVSAFSGVTDSLFTLGNLSSSGKAEYKKLLSDLETRHFEAVRSLIDVRRQSGVLAGVKVMMNELEDVLHGTFLLRDLSPKTMDFIAGFGERLSAYIISEAFQEPGILPDYYCPEFLDARKFIRTNNQYGSAQVDFEATTILIAPLKEKMLHPEEPLFPIITGFIGSTESGHSTTLGRGGSDYTASIFGAALNSDEIQIWTDVDGFMTADPRKVSTAFPIPFMSYEEALEMSNSGAKVLYPPTVQPAMLKKIPIRICNTFNPSFEGTVISTKPSNPESPVCGISSLDGVSLLRLQGTGLVRVVGTARRMFTALSEAGINVILISQASSEHSICVAISPSEANKAKLAVTEAFKSEIQNGVIEEVTLENDLCIVAAVGENMRSRTGISGWLFQTLGKNGINIIAIAQGSAERNISIVIRKVDESKALNVLHEVFFLSNKKVVNLFMIGTGLIGGTFLKQLQAHTTILRENQALELRVVGLARSKKMIFEKNGIRLENWKSELEKSNIPMSLSGFIDEMKRLNMPNSIFIDCTSNDTVASVYNDVLSSSISVVTPNKRANSGSFSAFREMHLNAIKNDVKFLYETNVGAGLPVINTLNDLLASGDQIIKIEAVLSGSLSFIFNTFKPGMKFSEVVKLAKEQGYTEPDPRDDLSGTDVARKILILSRVAGAPLELSDVSVNPFLPKECFDAESVDSFFKELEKLDGEFELMVSDSEKKGEKLRFIAAFENGRASVSLQSVDMSHPFYLLSGSDNIISYTTLRYKERPLVIKGPGAGAEVTAAGVFANVISISSYLS
ncbi:MAG: bifunctional aspartate kinase/homoserine dehydrogenase I [Chloroherpetonaceae bacterium]|nr:bifunctional aspartate kinase/homoserine dehydrogenase I [Chloroherpetonaceae bacterium]